MHVIIFGMSTVLTLPQPPPLPEEPMTITEPEESTTKCLIKQIKTTESTLTGPIFII